MVSEMNLKARTVEEPSVGRWAWWIAVLAIVVATAAVRWRLIDVPLERDEGEYAYAGQLILGGVPPYEQIYSMKLPGIYAAYAALLALFGQSHSGIHLGLLLINAVTIVLVYLLTRRLGGEFAGVVAAAAFAVLSVSQSVQGVFANAEHFVILPAVGGFLVLVSAIEKDRLVLVAWSGLLLGLAFLMKQHGGAFVISGGLLLLIDSLRRRPLDWQRIVSGYALFALCAAAPLLLTCLLLWTVGVFDSFWFWTVTYARTYVKQLPLELALAQFTARASRVVSEAPLTWGLVGIGLTAIGWNAQTRRHWPFLVLFALFSFLAICPGFYFRPHYFVLTLPAAALLVGVGVGAVTRLLVSRTTPLIGYGVGGALAVVCLAAAVIPQREFLFTMAPSEVARVTYGRNPFPESLEIAEIIRSETAETDRIAVIGSEPQIYFYAARRGATGYIYTYGLMEKHDFALQMQQEMIREIRTADPAALVFVNVWTSWLEKPESHRLIFSWFERYRREFKLTAVVDISAEGARYYRGADLAELRRRPRNSVEVYTRVGGHH